MIWGQQHQHSYALYRSIDRIEGASIGVYKLDNIDDIYDADEYLKLKASVAFLKKAVNVCDKHFDFSRQRLRDNPGNGHSDTNAINMIAKLAVDLISHASAVTGPPDTSWWVHHNTVWGELFGLSKDSKAWRFIHHRVRRLLYNELKEFQSHPNFKNARMLGFCLNVMGVTPHKKQAYGSEFYALHKCTLSIARSSFLKVWREYPDVASACLIGGISFDEESGRIIKTYGKGLKSEPTKKYLKLDKASV